MLAVVAESFSCIWKSASELQLKVIVAYTVYVDYMKDEGALKLEQVHTGELMTASVQISFQGLMPLF
jgi:hypothetical protein